MLMTRQIALNLLKLKESASVADVELAYVRIAIANHPYRKSSSSDTTKIFKEVSIAYKRLNQSVDEDWVEQFNSMDLFQSVFGDLSDSDSDFYIDDDDDQCSLCTCCHLRCIFCCPFCESDYPFYCDPEKFLEMKEKADKMAEELMKEEDEKRAKASHKKEKKTRRREKRKNSKENVDSEEENSFCKMHECRFHLARKKKERKVLGQISNENLDNEQAPQKFVQRKLNRKKSEKSMKKNSKNKENDECKEQIKNENFTDTDHSSKSIKCFQKWMDNANITDKNRFEVLTSHNEDSTHERTSERKSKAKQKPPKKVPVIKKNKTKIGKKEVPSFMIQDSVSLSKQLASQGNQLAGNEEYEEAIKLFTHAIHLLNTEFRYYGNRSYCYDRLGRYERALEDAEIATELSPTWAKGYFRKARALTGLKNYTEAEKAYEEVLRLESTCLEAKRQLHEVQLIHLMEMGFSKEQCEQALRKTGCVQFALDDLLSTVIAKANCREVYVSDDDDSRMFDDVVCKSETQKQPPATATEIESKSLWIGNIVPHISELALEDHFVQYGKIASVKALYDRHCAFINFHSPLAVKRALASGKSVEVAGVMLSVRIPQKIAEKATAKDPVTSTEECRYWRSTGCIFGSLCRYLHVLSNKGIDLPTVERTPYQSVVNYI